MYVYKKKIYIAFFTILDMVGLVLTSPFRRVNRKYIPAGLRKILLIRVDHIGDMISSTVVVPYIRKAYPEAEIDFMAASSGSDILEGDPGIDHIVKFDPAWFDRGAGGVAVKIKSFFEMIKALRKGQYDLAIDLRGDSRHIAAVFMAGIKNRISYGITGLGFLLTHCVPYEGIIHETGRNIKLLEPLGISYSGDAEPELHFSDDDLRKAGEILNDSVGGGAYAVIHVFPGRPEKMWTAEGFSSLARWLSELKGLIPMFAGSGKDTPGIENVIEMSGVPCVDLSERTSLGILGCVIDRATVFIGVDSGPSHMAAALNTPSVVLFSGTDDPEQWAPKGKKVRVICPGKGKDLSSVTLDEVKDAVEEVLEELKGTRA